MSAPDDEHGLDKASDLQLVGRLWPFVRPDAWTLGLALLLTPAIAALNLAQPLLLKEAIDKHLVPEVLVGLDQVALLYLGAVLGAYLTEAAYSLALSWGGERTILRLRKALYGHALTLAQRFFDRQPAGKLLTRVTNDVEALGESIASGVVSIVLDLLLILGIGGTMLWLNWQLSLLLLLLAPPLLGSIEWMRLQLKRLFVVVREAQADLNAFLAERVDGAQVIQLQGAQPWAEAEFARRSRAFTEANKSANIYDAAMFAVVDGASRIFVAVVLWWGTGLSADALAAVGIDGAAPPLSVGLLVAFMDYLDRLFRPLRELSGKITILQRAATSLQRLFWLLDVDDKVAPGAVAAPRLQGALVLEGVRFRYRPDQPEVLKGVDLRVEPGQSVAGPRAPARRRSCACLTAATMATPAASGSTATSFARSTPPGCGGSSSRCARTSSSSPSRSPSTSTWATPRSTPLPVTRRRRQRTRPASSSGSAGATCSASGALISAWARGSC